MLRALFISFTLFLVSLQPANAQSLPSYDSVYLNDFAGLLSDANSNQISSKLKTLRSETGIEFVVVTIPRMRDYGHAGGIESFATKLFNTWGVGDASANNGVMLLVSRFDRRVRIEVGSGYGASKNSGMKAIIDHVIIPEFKNDRYSTGITKGVDAIIDDLNGKPFEKPSNFNPVWIFILFFIAFFGLSVLASSAGKISRLSFGRFRKRRCPNDGSKMYIMSEADEDAFLSKGQIHEEDIGSQHHDVWCCPTCDHKTIASHERWFSSYKSCKDCGYHTLEVDEEISIKPTWTMDGQRRSISRCSHCGTSHETFTVYTYSEYQSDTSSSSGSFGGGSSSGGGASGSW